MFRILLIYLSQAVWARKLIQRWGFAQKMSARFIAGETLDQAIEVVKILNKKGINTTLDHLGENVSSREGSILATGEILSIIDRLKNEGVASGISIKLSQIGLVVDRGICEENLKRILERSRDRGIFLRVDMEDSQIKDLTLNIFSKARREGYTDTAGIAIQAYLYDSEKDIQKLLESNTGIRLCKGAYKEPPGIAFPRKEDVDNNFDLLMRLLVDRSFSAGPSISTDGIFPPIPAIATHDEDRINQARYYTDAIDLPKNKIEFQMLYGIRSDLQDQLVEEGYPVRVYVPYGSEWYPYFVRRLAERPANLWFFITNLIRK